VDDFGAEIGHRLSESIGRQATIIALANEDRNNFGDAEAKYNKPIWRDRIEKVIDQYVAWLWRVPLCQGAGIEVKVSRSLFLPHLNDTLAEFTILRVDALSDHLLPKRFGANWLSANAHCGHCLVPSPHSLRSLRLSLAKQPRAGLAQLRLRSRIIRQQSGLMLRYRRI
jgi:hypothetical protein